MVMSETKFEQFDFVLDDTSYETLNSRKFKERRAWAPPEPDKMKARIPGTILQVYVKEGQAVKRGDPVLVLEAMKMANDLASPADGTIKAVHVKEGDTVPKGELLVELKMVGGK